ncbi:MAG: 1,4-dihydroxy-6-naphthoate synthase [Deltaproteobacteria bacterium]|nr:1,4-dihydroxy-6-naphthoate synthase [Deltaproteobacteria bacterium]TLN03430.1 MAG: 1,4-dihydroxy-6-naphthoate synthase [bacterium]
MRTVTLGYSPCPNDTFLFYPLVHHCVPCNGFQFRERLEDVETLNRLAMEGTLDVCKVSYHAYALIRERYILLRSGGAMGRGCGPLVVARTPLAPGDLKGKRIAAPGQYTTACLLLQLFEPKLAEMIFLPFDKIMTAVAAGQVDAGLIIHESRFTYPSYGLHKVLDLGEWWETSTGFPLPLGGIAAKRSLGPASLATLSSLVRSSVEYALRHPAETLNYVRAHSQEMSEEVCASHIALYVNDYSLDPSPEGESAAELLFARGAQLGLFPRSSAPLFVPATS